MTEPTPPDDNASRVAELERRIAELEASTTTRVVQAELKAHATKAGMVDLDGLKLIDTTALKLTESGEVEGAARLMSDLRRTKPWLFQPASSSSAALTPPSTPPTLKRATDMSHAEWQAARANLLKRR